ncbi:MAG: Hsp20/alpha crystallin family protein [Actinomycetota bacterium]
MGAEPVGPALGAAEPTRPGATGSWVPPLDVFEDDDRLVVKVELPGIDPEAVEVSVEDSTLTVSGSREFERETEERNYHRIERRYGAFSRSLRLPQTADAERVDARFDKGVLTIEVPKREEAKPRRIEIKASA